MPIAATRAMLTAALSGELDQAELRTDAVFGFQVPVAVPGVDSKLLDPRSTWADPAAYDVKARELAQMFVDNFAKRSATSTRRSRAAGPRRLATAARARSASVRSRGSDPRRPRRRSRLRGYARGHRGVRRRGERRCDLEAASDPEPFGRGRGRHQRGARQRRRGLRRVARVRHRQGLRLHRRPGRDRDLHARGAGRHLPARALGRGLLEARRRQARAAPVRRRRLAAHRVRRRHHRPRADPGALRAARASATSRSTRSTSPGSSSRTTAAARASSAGTS